MSTVAGILASLAAIMGAIYGVCRLIGYAIIKTEEQKSQEISATVQKEEDTVKKTGRP